MVPVVFAQKCLPVYGFELNVDGVSYTQFKNLAPGDQLAGRSLSSASEWHSTLSSGFYSLEDALKVSGRIPLTNKEAEAHHGCLDFTSDTWYMY